ncbi:MAG: tetratricopeptide repeat protein [Alphaproteobacteria bacterium]|nr:tetratricopeptide repeat protein [Alphaproteobacteria bacterium]
MRLTHATSLLLLCTSLALTAVPGEASADAPDAPDAPAGKAKKAKKPKPAKKPKRGKAPEVSEEDANDPAKLFQAGIESLVPDRKGVVNHEAAYDFFAKSAQFGNTRNAQFNAGWVAEKLGRIDLATMHYGKAFALDPSFDKAMHSYARVLTAQGKQAEVPEIFSTYLSSRPDDADVRGEYLEALVEAGRYDDAVAQAQALLRANPDDDVAYRALSSMYLKQGGLGMAQIMGDKALALNDADPNIYNNMGVVLLQNDDLPGAIERFQTARKLSANHYEANVNLGLIAVNAGDYALALETFEAALATQPSSYLARLGKAVALRGTGDYAGADAIYTALMKEDPSKDDPFFNAATLHEKYTKDFAKALKILEAYKEARVGKLGPNDPVFKRIQAIEAAKAAEEERKRLEAERKKAEEERKRRAMELLTQMETTVTDLQTRIDANRACLPEEVSMELDMAVETAAMVISEQDTSMAADLKSMLDEYYLPMLDTAIADGCGGGPAPEAGGDDAAPAEGDDAAPAEEAPAEEAAAPEEAPATEEAAAPAEAPPAEEPPPAE